ncbi:helix-turn-helix domain-containing protein [Streptomyces sp. URMC 126]|uniref:helix-turn-helix domain-containing protein n=1 Tax=Streptomyces sp. URMC 126 TaxID=3423401 RepID=UPI003F1BEEBF
MTSAPHPALSAFVLGYLGFDERVGAPVRRKVVATVAPAVLIDLAPVGRYAAGTAFRAPTLDGMVCGLVDAPVDMELGGHHFGVVISLTPPGAAALLDVPMHELANTRHPLSTLMGPARLRRITHRLAAADDWPTRFGILDELLLGYVTRRREPPRIAVSAWRHLRASAGGVPVRHLAESTGVSRRRLEQVFREHVGCTPKTAARILRFRKALMLITNGTPGGDSLAVVAAQCGYSDHAHLSREVRALAGAAPASLRRRLGD